MAVWTIVFICHAAEETHSKIWTDLGHDLGHDLGYDLGYDPGYDLGHDLGHRKKYFGQPR